MRNPKTFWVLWLLYLLGVTLLSILFDLAPKRIFVSNVQYESSVKDKEAKVLYKTLKGEYIFAYANNNIQEAFWIGDTLPSTLVITVGQNRREVKKKDFRLQPLLTDSLYALGSIERTEKVYKLLNLPTVSNLRLIKQSPYLVLAQVVNGYGWIDVIKAFFSPLVVLTLLVGLFYRKIFAWAQYFFQGFSLGSLGQDSKLRLIDRLAVPMVFILLFLYMEYKMPYYFLQDDNYTQFAPALLYGLEMFYKDGSLPLYNFYQLNGTPLLGYTTYCFFYPLLHIAYGTSLAIGDKYQIVDIFVFLNLLGAAIILDSLLARMQTRLMLRIIAVQGILFSGFTMVTIRSWYYVAPYFLMISFVVWIVHWLVMRQKVPSLKQSLGIGIVLGAFAYAGNVQFWLYSLVIFCFLLLCSLLLTERSWQTKVFFRKANYLLIILTVALVTALPWLLLGYIETNGLERNWVPGKSFYSNSWAAFINFVVEAGLPNSWGNFRTADLDPHFYHLGLVGTIGLWAGLLLLILFIRNVRMSRTALEAEGLAGGGRQEKVFFLSLLFVLGFCFLMSMGVAGLMYCIQILIPVVKDFSLSFKYWIFVVVFTSLVGVVVLNFLFEKIESKRLLDGALGVSLLLFTWLHIGGSDIAFYKFTRSNPYPKLPFADKGVLDSKSRIFSYAPIRSTDSTFYQTLQHNFPTIYRVFSNSAYEPLNPRVVKIDTLAHIQRLKQLGVNRIVVWKEMPLQLQKDMFFTEEFLSQSQSRLDSIFEKESLLYSSPLLQIYALNGAVPLVFGVKEQGRVVNLPFSLEVFGDRLKVTFTKEVLAEAVVFNYIYNYRFKVFDENGQLYTITPDSLNRTVAVLHNSPITSLTLKYSYF